MEVSPKYQTALDDLQRDKRECEAKIIGAVRAFEQKTSLTVGNIDVEHAVSTHGKQIISVQLEVTL